MSAKIIFLLLGLFVFVLPCRADVVYLKDGRRIECKILEQTEYAYKIEVNGMPMMYYPNEVAKVIRGQEGPVSPAGTILSSQQPAPPISATKEELIIRLVAANGARESMARIFQQIIEEAPKENQAQLKDLLKVDEIIKRLAPIYDKYYTEDDLKELITFYRSPVGVKHLQATPKVMADTLQEAVKYFQEKVGPFEAKDNPENSAPTSPKPAADQNAVPKK